METTVAVYHKLDNNKINIEKVLLYGNGFTCNFVWKSSSESSQPCSLTCMYSILLSINLAMTPLTLQNTFSTLRAVFQHCEALVNAKDRSAQLL